LQLVIRENAKTEYKMQSTKNKGMSLFFVDCILSFDYGPPSFSAHAFCKKK